MTCPACNVLLPISARRVQTCPTCARSLVVTEDSVRLATAADIRALEPHEIDALRKGRSDEWRENTKARLDEIRGK